MAHMCRPFRPNDTHENISRTLGSRAIANASARPLMLQSFWVIRVSAAEESVLSHIYWISCLYKQLLCYGTDSESSDIATPEKKAS